MRKLTPREESGLPVALVCILLAIGILMFTAEAKADDTGVYFKAGIGAVSGYDTDGIPVELELGWRGGELDLIGSPRWYARYNHYSDFTGAIIGEALGTEDDDYSLDTVGVGLCWGAC